MIRNVRDLETANRRTLESLLGQPLQEDEQVIIRVISVGKEPNAATKQAALIRAQDVAVKAAQNRESSGVLADEADRVIDEAIDDVRRNRS
jgi:hypothetical protein